MRFTPARVRIRLTLWYVAMLAVLLLGFIGVTAALLRWQLQEELTRHAIQDLETVEGLISVSAHGSVSVRDDYHNHPESRLVQERFLAVLAPDGRVLFGNDRLAGRALGGALQPQEGVRGYSPRAERLADGSAITLVSRRHTVDGHDLIIRVGYSTQPIADRTREFVVSAAMAFPILLAAAGLIGYSLATAALRPMDHMARQADAMTAEDLHLRLPVPPTDDELAHLAQVFNRLLTRLEEAFRQLQRFTSDASHELRTPLAAMRSVGEVSLSESTTVDQCRDTIGSMLEEATRLTALVDSLLEIARADAGTMKLQPTVFAADDLVAEATSLIDVLAEEKEQQLVVGGSGSWTIEGDRAFLRQALVNVLHNAVKYTPRGGVISIVTSLGENRSVILIRDSGPGIPDAHLPRVFDRFYRVDGSRTRAAGGVGLGLSIARWAVEAHGGTITAASPPEGGATFRIELPRSLMIADRFHPATGAL